MIKPIEHAKGRGAGFNPDNPHLKQMYVVSEPTAVDEIPSGERKTVFRFEHPKTVVNKAPLDDVGLNYSMNPYQGCEHGCVYCYARPTHQYWGLSAGLDFEQVVIVKENAPRLLAKFINKGNWTGEPIALSGNTDCYQPAEKEFKITRKCLEVFLAYNHPVTIITKNHLILRDLDLLKELARKNLVRVTISLTTLNETLRRNLEPRTSTGLKRLETIAKLKEAGIPVTVNIAPIIPGLNHIEIPVLLKEAAEAGAYSASMIMVRLNGPLGDLFTDWLKTFYPDRMERVLNLIKSCHGGKLSDSRPEIRMRGEGNVADSIRKLFLLYQKKYFTQAPPPELTSGKFISKNGKQMEIF